MTPCKHYDKTPEHNARLCEDCQPWNNLTHLLQCTRLETSETNQELWLDPYQFTQSGRGAKMVTPTHGLKDLTYHDVSVYEPPPRKACVLCRVVGDLLQQFSQQQQTSTTPIKFGPWRPFAMRHADSSCIPTDHSSDSSTAEICLLPGAILALKNGVPSNEPIVLKFTLHYSTPRFGLRAVTPWNPPDTLSLTNLNKWLANCQSNHTNQCNSFAAPMSLPAGLRLIDTTTNSIVLCTSPVPYVALSYCWAGAAASPSQNLQLLLKNVNYLSQPGSLNLAHLPPVIADAIHLCHSLAHRHLWVDQLCIIQDDPISKGGQIEAMDSIYHTAMFTIVDLSTVPGLPGTAKGRSMTPHGQWDGTLDAVFGEANSPVAKWAIDRSVWDTRGWTFQERKLSRRMVFVDRERAWFSCYRGSFWEYDARAWTMQGEEEEVPQEDGEVGVHLTETFRSYAALVGPYSERKLSFRTDRLNAFMGVGNVLGKRLETKMVDGLPERWLMQGLLWRGLCGGGWEEKLGFPSWSWAGWDGRVDWGMGETAVTERGVMAAFWSWYGPEVGSLVTFWYSSKSDGVRRLEEGRWWFTGQDMWDEDYEEHQYVLRERVKERPEDARAAAVVDSWDRCCHNPWEMLRRMDITDEARSKAKNVPGSLVFTTTCMLLNLRLNDDASGGAVCFDIVDDDGGFVGQTMMADRDWAKTFDLGRKYGIVVIGAGEANGLKERAGPVWRDPATGRGFRLALYVLVTDHKDGVLYRFAVGVVELSAWTKLGPAWRSVVLG